MKKDYVVHTLVFIMGAFFTHVKAQKAGEPTVTHRDSVLSLQIENTKTGEHRSFVEGKSVHYKLRSGGGFIKGRIAKITDSTISFQGNMNEGATIPFKDFSAFKFRRKAGRSIAGIFFIALGTSSLINAAQPTGSDASGVEGGIKAIEIVACLPLIAGGVILLIPKKVDMEKSWKFNAAPVKIAIPLYKKFKLGLGIGYAGGIGGRALYIEPMYRITDKFSIGAKYESVTATITATSATDSISYANPGFPQRINLSQSTQNWALNIKSVSLNFQYYINKKTFRPFVGLGLAVYSQAGASNTVGYCPRIGFDYNHLNLTIDYNVLSAASESVYTDKSTTIFTFTIASTSVPKYTYAGFKIGYSFGGGRR